MRAVSTFTMGNYPCQAAAVSLFVISLGLMKVKFDVIKDVSCAKISGSFAKMSKLFTFVEVLTQHTLFTVSLFIYLLVGS